MEKGVKVELTGVTKYYGQRCLFENITACLEPGRCLAVTGPNGSGKSTFLKIIAGLVRPSAGTVRLINADGREIMARNTQPGTIGLISPELVFYPMLTGCENLAFLARAAGTAVSPGKILACLNTVGLTRREHEAVATYSTGQRQRLKFALLLALRPPVWLLDEPSSNLDASGKDLIFSLIRQALAAQVAVLIATNEAEEADYAADKISLA